MDRPSCSKSGCSQEKRDYGKAARQHEKNEAQIRDEEEIVRLCRQMDEKLEDRAKAHNMSAINVKSLLHHLLKNPDMISKITGLNEEANVPNLKLTRSKVKQLRGSHELKSYNMESDAVAVPRIKRTFLSVDYGEDEDEDDDYKPDRVIDCNQEEDDEEVEDACNEMRGMQGNTPDDLEEELLKMGEKESCIARREEEFAVDDAAHSIARTRSRTHNPEIDLFVNESISPENDVLLYSVVDDPDYMTFITTLNDPEPTLDFDEMDDPEYDFMADEIQDETEKDELRMDRATEIPLREVEDLFQDLFASNVDVTAASNDLENAHSNETEIQAHDTEIALEQRKPSPSGRLGFPTFSDHVVAFIGATQDVLDKTANSCSLFGCTKENPPKFTHFEREQLQTQLTKHVQLLTQFVIGCQFEPELESARDAYQEMINALHDLRERSGNKTCFDISNLDACIVSCHDARTAGNATVEGLEIEKDIPRFETMLVLSRSEAIVYPDLVPEVRLHSTPFYYRYFTSEEDHLLALGVYEFSHVPHNNSQRLDGRNALISRNYLPTKTASQIKNHMKNFRLNPKPLYTYIARAEQGKVTLVFPTESSEGAQSKSPVMWDIAFWPKWLKQYYNEISRCLSDSFRSVGLKETTSLLGSAEANHRSKPCHGDISFLSSQPSVSQTVDDIGTPATSTTSLAFFVDASANAKVAFLPVAVQFFPILIGGENFFSAAPVNKDVGDADQHCTATTNDASASCFTESITSGHIDNDSSSSEVITLLDTESVVESEQVICRGKKKNPEISPTANPIFETVSMSRGKGRDAKENTTNISKVEDEKVTLMSAKYDEYTTKHGAVDLIKELEMSDSETSTAETCTEIISELGSEFAGTINLSIPITGTKNSCVGNSFAAFGKPVRILSSENLGDSFSSSSNVSTTSFSGKSNSDCYQNCAASQAIDQLFLSFSDSESGGEDSKASFGSAKNTVLATVDGASRMAGEKSFCSENDLQYDGKKCQIRRDLLEEISIPIKRTNSEEATCSSNMAVLKGTRIRTSGKTDEEAVNISGSCSITNYHDFGLPRSPEKTLEIPAKDSKSSHCGSTPLITPRLRSSPCSFVETDNWSSISAASGVDSAHLEQMEWSREDYVPKTPRYFTPSTGDSTSKQATVSCFPKKGAKNLFGTFARGPTSFEHCSLAFERAEDVGSTVVKSTTERSRIRVDDLDGNTSVENFFYKEDSSSSHAVEDVCTTENDLEEDLKEKDDDGGSEEEKNRIVTKPCKKRNKRDRLMNGLHGMLDEAHREKQFKALSKVILNDFKQQMFMHQDKIRAVQKLINSERPSPLMFEALYRILAPKHSLLLILLSLIFPDSALPESAVNSSLRKAFFAAIEMVFNIEAYTNFGKTKLTARRLFRSIRQLGPFCSCSDLEKRLSEMISNEDPLWCAVSANLPSKECSSSFRDVDYEFIDMENWSGVNADYEDVDLSSVLGPNSKRRQTAAHISDGSLFLEKNGKMCEFITENALKTASENTSKAKTINATTLKKTDMPASNTQDLEFSAKSSCLRRSSCPAAKEKRPESRSEPKKTRKKLRKRERTVKSPVVLPNQISFHENSKFPEDRRSCSITKKEGDPSFLPTPVSKVSEKLESSTSVTTDLSSCRDVDVVAGVSQPICSTINSSLISSTAMGTTSEELEGNLFSWSKPNDKILLYSYNDSGCDFYRAVELAGERLTSTDKKAIGDRLVYLLSFFK